jgi:hypothetical protein
LTRDFAEEMREKKLLDPEAERERGVSPLVGCSAYVVVLGLNAVCRVLHCKFQIPAAERSKYK